MGDADFCPRLLHCHITETTMLRRPWLLANETKKYRQMPLPFDLDQIGGNAHDNMVRPRALNEE